eukprot:CAMPEP_0175292508 /NCGR_PEP_ID=MMETSP0093-20121207/56976_1 /TAXON_ID=311494 /ORGANISM="Alexandrium monilatum, Strain CCMP3105" /LENGTH=173 /DNA_ID=CAMNT_0016588329 /DNA_START=101 /DNA_END=622 /DNA_ORIENTATION=-
MTSLFKVGRPVHSDTLLEEVPREDGREARLAERHRFDERVFGRAQRAGDDGEAAPWTADNTMYAAFQVPFVQRLSSAPTLSTMLPGTNGTGKKSSANFDLEPFRGVGVDAEECDAVAVDMFAVSHLPWRAWLVRVQSEANALGTPTTCLATVGCEEAAVYAKSDLADLRQARA